MRSWLTLAAVVGFAAQVSWGQELCPSAMVDVGMRLTRGKLAAASESAAPGLASASPQRTAAVASANGPALDRTALAREAALFLIETAYEGASKDDLGNLRTANAQILLHGNRLRFLIGAGKVPIAFMTDLEARTRRSSLGGRALEERLWALELAKAKADPKFQPETVRQVVTVISKVLERKEVKPLADFVLEHYEDALAILGVSNEVDELRWKVVSLVMQEKLDQDTTPEAPPTGLFEKLKARAGRIARAAEAILWRTPSWKVVSKDLLMALASSDHQPLNAHSLDLLRRFGNGIQNEDRRNLYEAQLKKLIHLELDLAESLTSYHRQYRAAVLLKKLLHDLACTDGKLPLESYSIARQAMEWRLNDHPYVRHVVETGLMGANQIYHPYLCVPLAVGRPLAEIDDPLLAAQALTPEILSALYDESSRVGLERMVREWDAREADKTLAEVEGVLKRSSFNAGAAVLTTATSSVDPKYEKQIGAALGPIVERLKQAGKGSVAPDDKEKPGDDPWLDETKEEKEKKKKKKEESPLDPWDPWGTEGEKKEEKKKSAREEKPGEPLDTEPMAYLLERIQDYLGPEATKINWDDVRHPKVTKKPREKEKEGEKPAEAKSGDDAWDNDTLSSSAKKKKDEIDFSVSYPWVDAVYELLNKKADEARTTDLKLETDAETKKLAGETTPLFSEERNAAMLARQGLIETFLNVQHAIEACIIGQQGIRKRDANDDEISTDALRVAAFYLKKHRSLSRFLSNYSHADPSLRALWVRLFLRVAEGHMDLKPHTTFPSPSVPVTTMPWQRRWLRIAGFGCALVATSVMGAVIVNVKGCTGDKPPAVQKADPGGAVKDKGKTETPAKDKGKPPKPAEDPWGDP